MSLTRDQWIEMWLSTKYIEIEIDRLLTTNIRKDALLKEVRIIKKLIQSVIGQQEK